MGWRVELAQIVFINDNKFISCYHGFSHMVKVITNNEKKFVPVLVKIVLIIYLFIFFISLFILYIFY